MEALLNSSNYATVNNGTNLVFSNLLPTILALIFSLKGPIFQTSTISLILRSKVEAISIQPF